MTMKTRAAVLRKHDGPWEIEEIDLDDPKEGEVVVRFMAAGLCHSDEHVRAGLRARLPMVGGHEGAGVVEAVGPGVTRVAEGDHVAASFIPVCGTCRYCSTGHQNLCDAGLNAGTGLLRDGTFRFHSGDDDMGGMCVLGTFSQRAVVSEWSCVKIEPDLPFELAALVSCGVTTGWCSAVYAAGVKPGDTVVIFGIGGVGINAVQGASFAGAKHVIAIDPVEFKLEMARMLGATHTTTSPAEAHQLVVDLTRGQLADHAILTVGEMNTEVVQQAVNMVGKTSQVTMTGVGDYEMQLPGNILILYQRRIQGACFGGANPLYDIPKILGLYRTGDIKLDELITRRYRLEQINDGFRDMMDGKNVRGVIIHEH
jgi:alcohol dehydrogenase (nicotinoprotein)